MSLSHGYHLPGLSAALDLDDREVVSAYGGGGKTSFLLRLAEDLAGKRQKAIFTTTTKLRYPRDFPAVIATDFQEAAPKLRRLLKRENIVALGSELLPDAKMKGVEPSWIDRLFADGAAPYILVEADGAAGRPIKGYAPYEPVLPESTTLLAPLLGLDAVGLPLEAGYVHRPELLIEQIGAEKRQRINADYLIRCLFFMLARGKEQAPDARVIPLLNKADLIAEIRNKALIRKIAEACFTHPDIVRLLITALGEKFPLHYIIDIAGSIDNSLGWRPHISCAILAAGFSRRMGGADKLALTFDGKTILEHALESAVQGGADDVFIVTRPEQVWVEKLFPGEKIRIVKNHFAAEGMSASVKAAVSSAHPLTQGILFALGDQPFVEPEVYKDLIQSYRKNLNLVTFPCYEGKRGNPQLFDRKTWPHLLELQGDQGGKGILHMLPEQECLGVETACPGVVADIDTMEDYGGYGGRWGE